MTVSPARMSDPRLTEPSRPQAIGRDQIVDYLERHLIGPFEGDDEVLDAKDIPNKRYLMATLFPPESSTDEELVDEEQEGASGTVKDEVAEDPVALSNSWMPSSLGLSFYVSGQGDVSCDVWGARYEITAVAGSQVWRRVPIAKPSAPERVRLQAPPNDGYGAEVRVLDGRARLTSYWRRFPQGYLVTVVLINAQQGKDDRGEDGERRVDPALCLHQVGFECRAANGAIMEYPSVDVLSRDPEDEELRVLHRRAKVFAVGHGCAADWEETDAPVTERRTAVAVRTVHLPTFEVPALTHEGPGDVDVLRIARLADEDDDPAALFADMRRFIDHYDAWIEGLRTRHPDIPAELDGAADRLITRLSDVAKRLRAGVDALANDPLLLRAFRLANLAMLMQMKHAAKDVAGTRRARGQGAQVSGGYLSLDRKWRPFQLAYMLLCIPSLANDHAGDRDTVDLLWFPTGGGKTEAYLTLAAFQILLRRLRSGDRGAGTTVITRYTLRLLTAQQFQRATTLVCALERLRQDREAEMGTEPISIGLWVGEDQSPNDLAKAREIVDEMLDQSRPINKFQVEQCPWCGTEIIPQERGEREAYGVEVGNRSFRMFCPSDDCHFHSKLPISVIDEDLYRAPPTFLLATVDKFARLAWVEDAVVFFGGGRYEPPSLIIQDEMHLLSGPLGTTVAVYESAVEALTSYHGARPKILASTATIRNANEQVKGLFGRDVRVFPPPGLSADDSYFAVVDKERPGRKFVGVMAQSHTPQTATIHTAAALLQAPEELTLSPQERDAYWTLVAYHNSIRELGRTSMLARDDIPSRCEVIAVDQSLARKIDEPDVVELTGNVRGDELVRILARLNVESSDPDVVSVLVTTNMLSVGVDIPRLGLMLVNGQPKSTSEYIQATSRVGRGAVPGLVVVQFNSTKPRDRSHYESFHSYHSALYRYVEPTSVTPFSLPSRERSLHAAFVILMRHGAGLAADDAAGRFDPDSPETKKAIDAILTRVARVDPSELQATTIHLTRKVEEWADKANAARQAGRPLFYKPAGKAHVSLLCDFGSSGGGWPTLHSMRSVDRQCNVTIVGEH